MTHNATLALRLAGPLQSWGTTSQFNQRRTDLQPSKSGVIGLLAAAQGRRRGEPITDLVGLTLAVRVDQPGSLLRDYHTVSTLDGSALPAAKVSGRGSQESSGWPTKVTTRFYLQDAAFVALIEGPRALMEGLAEAVRRPKFFLALGRRSCPPSQPLLITNEGRDLFDEPASELVRSLPWQASERHKKRKGVGASVSVSATIDDPQGAGTVSDVPVSFDPRQRGFTSRRVRHEWVSIPTGLPEVKEPSHDPFALLGW